MWKRVKTALRRNVIGQQNADRLTMVSQFVSRYLLRGLRQLQRVFGIDLSPVPHLNRYVVEGTHTFFGYYDVTPFSGDNRKLLAMVAKPIDRTPRGEDAVSVGWFDVGDTGTFYSVAKTTTWCWQQGCRLRWYPENENELIIYNRLVAGRYGSVVQHIHTGKFVRELNWPIYDLDKTGQWALSLNFSRLQRLRPGYGYVNLPDKTLGNLAPADEGIWLIDVFSGKEELLLSLEFLSKFNSLSSMKGAEHYVNHLSFSPSGDHFMFIHRWIRDGNMQGRLIICGRDSGQPSVLEDCGSVSHYEWKSDRDLLVTVNYAGKPTRYNLYRDLTPRHSTIGPAHLDADGHPSYSPDGELLLTDTYPDKFGDQSLLLYGPENELAVLGKFYSPLKNQGERRCDLHPRWDRSGMRVCIDSDQDGLRSLFVIDL